jgi:hypothetical protein
MRARLPLPALATSKGEGLLSALVTFPFDWAFDFMVFN